MTEGKNESKPRRRGIRRTKAEIGELSEATSPAATPETGAAADAMPADGAEAPKKRTRRTTKKAAEASAPAISPQAETAQAPPQPEGEAAPAPKARAPRRSRTAKSASASTSDADSGSTPAVAVVAHEPAEPALSAEPSHPEPAPGEALAGASDEDRKPRRRRSRRGGKNRGAGVQVHGEQALPDTEEGQSPHPVPAFAGGTGESFADAPQNADVPETGESQPGVSLSELPGAPGEPVEGAAGGAKRRRRRRRRRNRKGKGPDGQLTLLEAGAEAEGADHDEEEGEVEETVAAAAKAGTAPEVAAVEGGSEAGGGRRSRSSRRRRGRGGEGRPADEVVGQPAGQVARAAADETGVEGAEIEDDDLEGDAEYTDTSASSDTRRVMMIDGTHPEEIRVAIVNDNVLDYFEFENQRKKQFKGNIYKGKVINIAPAIEAAFVEFGGGRHGFLPLNEYCGGALAENLDNWDEDEKRPSLRSGMEILVQVTKEESSVKGAALTSYISIAGRYLVMMLGMKRFGISKKITGEKERERLRKVMDKLEYPEHLGFIVRTEGEGRNLKDLKADLENLIRLWQRVLDGGKKLKAPALLYEEQDIVIRTLRDSYSSDFAEVLMNSEDSHRKAVEFFDIYYPKQKNKLKLYRQKRPLFSKFNLDEQLDKATSRRVALPSGGHIVIDRTEALWSIDVNSGRSSKDRDIEDTAFRTNKEAAVEVTRQLRIRDMGGLIVVDFIDMENKNHIKEVERTIKEGLKKDKAKNDMSAMGKFGLVAISRQRMGISFFDVMLKECDLCSGTGFVATSDALAVRLLRKLHDEMSREGTREIVARVYPSLLETLLNQKRDEISRLERLCNIGVSFVADGSLPPGGFHLSQAPQVAGS
jgi:Rne/Rng family ribonuclease